MFGLFSAGIPQITPREVEERLELGTVPCVLDVREPAEYADGHIPGSRHIPLGSLPARCAELSKDQEIVVVCRSGGRSSAAAQQLLEAGFKAINMTGGMLAWRGPVAR